MRPPRGGGSFRGARGGGGRGDRGGRGGFGGRGGRGGGFGGRGGGGFRDEGPPAEVIGTPLFIYLFNVSRRKTVSLSILTGHF